jgi:branched-subunit amino acid transport protein AzlD
MDIFIPGNLPWSKNSGSIYLSLSVPVALSSPFFLPLLSLCFSHSHMVIPAELRSRTPFGALLTRVTNFFVRIPSEQSYRLFPVSAMLILLCVSCLACMHPESAICTLGITNLHATENSAIHHVHARGTQQMLLSLAHGTLKSERPP